MQRHRADLQHQTMTKIISTQNCNNSMLVVKFLVRLPTQTQEQRCLLASIVKHIHIAVAWLAPRR